MAKLEVPGDRLVISTHYDGNGAKLHAVDLVTGKPTAIATLPADVTHVAVDTDGLIYVACSKEVYCVRRWRDNAVSARVWLPGKRSRAPRARLAHVSAAASSIEEEDCHAM